MEISQMFEQNENKTNITSIENTTEICIKSILCNSNKHNQSIITKHTKNVRFQLQEEEYEDKTIKSNYSEEMEQKNEEEIEMNAINDPYEYKENLSDFKEMEKVSNKEFENSMDTTENDILQPKTPNTFTSSLSQTIIKELLNETKIPFLKDFLNVTNSKQTSNSTAANINNTNEKINNHNTKTLLNEFQTFFEKNKEFLFNPIHSEEAEKV